MREKGYDALVLFADSIRSSNVLYVVNFKPIDGYTDIAWAVVVVPLDSEPTLYVSQMNLLWGHEVSWFPAKPFSELGDDLLKLHRQVGKGKVGLAGMSFMPVPVYDTIKGAFALTGVEIIPAEPLLGPIKATKSPAEIALLRRAGELTVVGLEGVKTAVGRDGSKTEREIAAYATAQMLEAGGDGAAMDIQIQSGPHAAYNNIRSTERVVRPGDSILIEMGAKYKEYRTDIARGATYGDVDRKQVDIIKAAADALGAGCDAVRPGLTAGELNAVIEKSLIDSGYAAYSAEARGYGTGHGIGTDIEEEEPWIRPNSSFVLGENMVMALKASIFVPELAGVRVEDEVLVTKSGADILTPYPRVLTW
jgi:Xaa-Pro aminopeptidase